MTTPLWMLLGFAVWTLAVLIAGVGVRRWSHILTGRAALTDFPADAPHGSAAYRRAMRAHANCVENLPVFAALVLIAEVARLAPPQLGALAAAVLCARVGQSLTHMLLPETSAAVAVRFAFFAVQVLAMLAMAALIAGAAAAAP